MSAAADVFAILAEAARERAEESVRWYASLTPAEKWVLEDAEAEFMRWWETTTLEERADHIRRQLRGQL